MAKRSILAAARHFSSLINAVLQGWLAMAGRLTADAQYRFPPF